MNAGDWIQVLILFIIVSILIGIVYLFLIHNYIAFSIAIIVLLLAIYVITRRIKL